jgi:hypothetical protein
MSTLIIPDLSNDAAEEFILDLANREKIVIPFGSGFNSPQQNLAFEKAIEIGWVRLIDIRPASPKPGAPPNTMSRMFMLTAIGMNRLNEIRAKKTIDRKLNS